MSYVKLFILMARIADYALEQIKKRKQTEELHEAIKEWNRQRVKRGQQIDAYWKHYVHNRLQNDDDINNRDARPVDNGNRMQSVRVNKLLVEQRRNSDNS